MISEANFGKSQKSQSRRTFVDKRRSKNAACRGHADIVKILISAGAEINTENRNDTSPLMATARVVRDRDLSERSNNSVVVVLNERMWKLL